MTLHVDMGTKKVVAFPDDILQTLARVKQAHAALPRPDGVGRSIKMPTHSR